jgi:hypothetical protein
MKPSKSSSRSPSGFFAEFAPWLRISKAPPTRRLTRSDHRYSAQTPTDRIAKLQAQIAAASEVEMGRRVRLAASAARRIEDPEFAMLVFSQTSLQRREINPATSRDFFYNDDVYLGYIPHAPMMEISAVDPKLGAVFYSTRSGAAGKAVVHAQSGMIQCHVSGRTLGVPGHFVRSLRTDGVGEIVAGTDTGEITHCTPLADRWGGWYVTGQHGAQSHLGNLIGASAFDRHSGEPGFRGNLPDLTEVIDTSKYLQPHSDIVALMVSNIRRTYNYITRLSYETRIMTKPTGTSATSRIR